VPGGGALPPVELAERKESPTSLLEAQKGKKSKLLLHAGALAEDGKRRQAQAFSPEEEGEAE
jgi:hypothetical protein